MLRKEGRAHFFFVSCCVCEVAEKGGGCLRRGGMVVHIINTDYNTDRQREGVYVLCAS
jgi:hypothetical protein